MILYVMEHLGYFSQMLTLRLNVHRDEGAIFAVYRLNAKREMYKNMQKCDLFDAVFTLAHTGRMAETESLILEEFQAKYDDFIQKIVGKNVKKTYISYDNFPSFSVLCELLKMDITTIEVFPNQINRLVPSFYTAPYEKGNCSEAFYILSKKLAPLDENRIPIKNIVVFPETKITDNEFVHRYDFSAEFDKVSETDKDKIIRMFSLDSKSFIAEKTSMLMLNNPSYLKGKAAIQSHANLHQHIYTEDKYALIYAVACDYVYDNSYNLVLCPHPYTGNKADPIKKNLIALTSVDGMPTEYLRYVPNFKIHQLISVKTTGTDKISDLTEQNIVLGLEFLSAFFYLDRLYTVGKILSDLKIFECLECYGIPQVICEHLFGRYKYGVKFSKNMPRLESNKAYVINVSFIDFKPLTNSSALIQSLKSAPNNCIVFFINSLFDYSFIDLDNTGLMEYIMPIIIKRNAITDNPLDEPGEKVIYAFTKDSAIRESLANFNLTKDLPFSGLRLIVEPISEERIKAERQRCYEFAVGRAALRKINLSSGLSEEKASSQQPHAQSDKEDPRIEKMASTIREYEAALKEARQHLHSYESFVAWKLLKPLRFIYSAIRRRRNKKYDRS